MTPYISVLDWAKLRNIYEIIWQRNNDSRSEYITHMCSTHRDIPSEITDWKNNSLTLINFYGLDWWRAYYLSEATDCLHKKISVLSLKQKNRRQTQSSNTEIEWSHTERSYRLNSELTIRYFNRLLCVLDWWGRITEWSYGLKLGVISGKIRPELNRTRSSSGLWLFKTDEFFLKSGIIWQEIYTYMVNCTESSIINRHHDSGKKQFNVNILLGFLSTAVTNCWVLL